MYKYVLYICFKLYIIFYILALYRFTVCTLSTNFLLHSLLNATYWIVFNFFFRYIPSVNGTFTNLLLNHKTQNDSLEHIGTVCVL